VEIKLSGTGPLSFEVKEGEELKVKEISPSSKSRPTAGSRFKTSALLVFKGSTKIGRIPPKNQDELGGRIPEYCKVIEVNKEKKVLIVEI